MRSGRTLGCEPMEQIHLDRIDEIKDLIKDDNLLGLHQAWKEFSNVNKLQILRDILSQNSVYVLCNHIKKNSNICMKF